jgi:hypothetical protein
MTGCLTIGFLRLPGTFHEPIVILPGYCITFLKNIPIFVLQPIAFCIVIHYKQLKYEV